MFLPKFLNFTVPNLIYILVTCFGNMIVPSLFLKQPGGAVTMASFSVILQLQSVLSFIPLMLSSPILAVLSNMFSSSGTKTWRDVKKLFFLFGGVLFFFGVMLFLCAKPLLALYGDTYIEIVSDLRLFIPAMIFQIICPLFNQVFSALEHLWLMIAARFVWMFGYIVSAVFLLSYGLRGIVYAVLFASVLWYAACQFACLFIRKTMERTLVSNRQN